MSNAAAATQIAETPRLIIRELIEADAPFINRLLNSPGFIKYIGDRGVRTDEDARRFLVERYIMNISFFGKGVFVDGMLNLISLDFYFLICLLCSCNHAIPPPWGSS